MSLKASIKKSFVRGQFIAAAFGIAISTSAVAELGYPEKEELKFGFIKLNVDGLTQLASDLPKGHFLS